MQAVEFINHHLGITLEECVKQYERLCHKISGKYKGGPLKKFFDYDDLFQNAMIGLIKAYQKYDPTAFDGKVTRFSTYAFPKIEGEIMRYLRDLNPGIKFSRESKRGASFINNHEMLRSSPEEILEKMHSESDQFDSFTISGVKKSLDCLLYSKPIFGDEAVKVDDSAKDMTLFDMISDDQDFSTVTVTEFLDWLPSTLSSVLSMRLEGKLQQEIADEMGLSQVHISRQLNEVKQAYFQFIGGQKKMARISKVNQQKAIRYLSETTKSYQEISKETGYSVSTLAEMAKQYRPKHLHNAISKARIQDRMAKDAKKQTKEERNKVSKETTNQSSKEEKKVVINETIKEERKEETKEENNKEIKEYGLLYPTPDEIAAKEEVMKVSESVMNVESIAPQTSRITRSFSFEYASSGEELPKEMVIQELETMIAMIRDSAREQINFDVLVKS